MSEGDSGWKNFETRSIAEHIDNTEDMHTEWEARATELLEQHEYDKAKAIEELAGELEKAFEEILEEICDNVFYGFAQNAFHQIDWTEIAEHQFAETDVYVVMWNMPGCLPEMEPMKFTDFEEARQAIVDELNSIDECDFDDDTKAKYEELIEEVENFSEPFTVEWEGYVYEVAKDE